MGPLTHISQYIYMYNRLILSYYFQIRFNCYVQLISRERKNQETYSKIHESNLIHLAIGIIKTHDIRAT